MDQNMTMTQNISDQTQIHISNVLEQPQIGSHKASINSQNPIIQTGQGWQACESISSEAVSQGPGQQQAQPVQLAPVNGLNPNLQPKPTGIPLRQVSQVDSHRQTSKEEERKFQRDKMSDVCAQVSKNLHEQNLVSKNGVLKQGQQNLLAQGQGPQNPQMNRPNANNQHLQQNKKPTTQTQKPATITTKITSQPSTNGTASPNITDQQQPRSKYNSTSLNTDTQTNTTQMSSETVNPTSSASTATPTPKQFSWAAKAASKNQNDKFDAGGNKPKSIGSQKINNSQNSRKSFGGYDSNHMNKNGPNGQINSGTGGTSGSTYSNSNYSTNDRRDRYGSSYNDRDDNNNRNDRDNNRSDRDRDRDRDRGDSLGGGNTGGGRRFPDNMQIFVGNLPADLTKHELTEHFKSAGSITEVRLNPGNPNQKRGGREPHSNGPNGISPPAFAFIVFEDSNNAMKIINNRKDWDILVHNNEKTRINIEAKQAKNRDAIGDHGRLDGRGGDRKSLGSFNSNYSSSTHSLNSTSSVGKPMKGDRRSGGFRY